MNPAFQRWPLITRDDDVVLLDIWDRYHKQPFHDPLHPGGSILDRVLVMASTITILADIRCPFPRPRDLHLGETATFNEVCAFLREKIAEGHSGRGNGRRATVTS
jgi:NitT/TauT family transport system ATP-binding protein